MEGSFGFKTADLRTQASTTIPRGIYEGQHVCDLRALCCLDAAPAHHEALNER
ncbi:MAG: hypothetical protein M3Q98_09550 [Actinomycetota bacterium]|nr:hypothetical protein [Actinomycetota bacterium]